MPLTGFGSMPLLSGHSLMPVPMDVSDWNGLGGVVTISLDDPYAPISKAYLDGGSTVGDPYMFEAQFKVLTSSVQDETISLVLPTVAVDGDNDGTKVPLYLKVEEGLLVTSLQPQ